MTLAERIAEARVLCEAIAIDLKQVEAYRARHNPESCEEVLSHIRTITLHELRELVYELEAHFSHQLQKRAKR